MAKINEIKSLKQTRAFYDWELKKESLTENERASYLVAKKNINIIIREKEGSEEKEKAKYFSKRGY